MNFDDFKALVGLSFRNPYQAGKILMSQGWPSQARWMALIGAVSVSALLAWLAAAIFASQADEGVEIITFGQQPLILAGMQFVAIVLASGLMAGVGRMFGGHGTFEDALLLSVWIEVLLLILQTVQLAISLILPDAAGLLGILAMALFLWLTVNFTKALHGFESTIKVVLGLIATAFVAGFLLSLLAASLGVLPEISS